MPVTSSYSTPLRRTSIQLPATKQPSCSGSTSRRVSSKCAVLCQTPRRSSLRTWCSRRWRDSSSMVLSRTDDHEISASVERKLQSSQSAEEARREEPLLSPIRNGRRTLNVELELDPDDSVKLPEVPPLTLLSRTEQSLLITPEHPSNSQSSRRTESGIQRFKHTPEATTAHDPEKRPPSFDCSCNHQVPRSFIDRLSSKLSALTRLRPRRGHHSHPHGLKVAGIR
jgi:hypothetical protein